MVCPQCGGENVFTQAVSEVYSENRGFWGWVGWIFLSIFTFGLILIIPLLTNKTVTSKTRTQATCQTCGYRWIVSRPSVGNVSTAAETGMAIFYWVFAAGFLIAAFSNFFTYDLYDPTPGRIPSLILRALPGTGIAALFIFLGFRRFRLVKLAKEEFMLMADVRAREQAQQKAAPQPATPERVAVAGTSLALKERIAQYSEHKDFRLVGNKNDEMQAALFSASEGSEIILEQDPSGEKYFAGNIGYLPEGAKQFIGYYDACDILAIVKNIIKDDNGKYNAIVTLYK